MQEVNQQDTCISADNKYFEAVINRDQQQNARSKDDYVENIYLSRSERN
tara:strand:+ start:1785 stop:1931 length:147 start_codon:yes stop_codon:yes gene_type:complete